MILGSRSLWTHQSTVMYLTSGSTITANWLTVQLRQQAYWAAPLHNSVFNFSLLHFGGGEVRIPSRGGSLNAFEKLMSLLLIYWACCSLGLDIPFITGCPGTAFLLSCQKVGIYDFLPESYNHCSHLCFCKYKTDVHIDGSHLEWKATEFLLAGLPGQQEAVSGNWRQGQDPCLGKGI